jgi:hypothetical protein
MPASPGPAWLIRYATDHVERNAPRKTRSARFPASPCVAFAQAAAVRHADRAARRAHERRLRSDAFAPDASIVPRLLHLPTKGVRPTSEARPSVHHRSRQRDARGAGRNDVVRKKLGDELGECGMVKGAIEDAFVEFVDVPRVSGQPAV